MTANVSSTPRAGAAPHLPRRVVTSAAIIALNEAHQLPSLVASLRCFDEIVVVDGGSNDGTAELAAELGCRVIVHPFDNFAAQRNRARSLCRGTWILSIDADERLAVGMAQELSDAIADDEFAAFRVPIRSRIFGRRMRFSGTQDDRPVRLFRKDCACWRGDVHERLAVRGRVGQLRAHLEHITLPDLASFLHKMDRYTTLEAQTRRCQGRRPRWRDRWLSPLVEFGRRFLWKGGMLDGPEGWAFCALSGLSKWIEADKHRRLWRDSQRTMRSELMHSGVIPRLQATRPAAVGEEVARSVIRGLPKSVLPLLQEPITRE